MEGSVRERSIHLQCKPENMALNNRFVGHYMRIGVKCYIHDVDMLRM